MMKITRGFTLLEILIVIIIIGILVTVALPLYSRTVEGSRMSEAYTQLSAIRNAELAYYNKYLVYSNNLNYLLVFVDNPNDDNLYPNRYFEYDNRIALGPSGGDFLIRCDRNTYENNLGIDYYIKISQNGTFENNFYGQ